MAVFIGDSEEEVEGSNFFGGTEIRKLRFPCFQLSRQMWMDYGFPTQLYIKVDNYSD